MNIKGVIFDLDGTLVHTIEDIGDAANMMLERHGMPGHTTTDYMKWIGNGAIKFVENALGPGISSDLLKARVSEFREIYGNNLHNKSRLYKGMDKVLDSLTHKGIKLSILSNKPHPFTKKVADYYLSDWDFNPVFGQRKHIPRKPDPAAAFEIAGKLQIKESEILFLGDSWGDIKTAEAAGMIPVGVTWGYGRLESLPQNGKICINEPLELLTLLTRLNQE